MIASPVPRHLHYPDVPVHAILQWAAEAYGDRPLIVAEDGSEYSARRLWADARRFANAMRARGVSAGDVVALHLPNSPEFVVAYYGILLAGATFTPVNPLLPEGALRDQLADAGARVIVTSDPDRLTGILPRNAVITVGEHPGSVSMLALLDSVDDTLPDVTIDPTSAIAHISYTGGTTGRSKGVELTHRNVVCNVLQFTAWLHGAVAVGSGDELRMEQIGAVEDWPTRLGTGRAINLTPWFHAMGTVGSLSVPILAGVSTVLHGRFDPARYLADAARLRVTSISGAPAVYSALLGVPDQQRLDLSSVTYLSSGAAPISKHLSSELSARFPEAVISEGYGLTEASMGVSYGPIARSGVRKVGSVGLAVSDTILEIRDPQTGVALLAGEPGELFVSGPQVMNGYHNRPDETERVLEHGWLRTGDIGILDADGYLSIVDRAKDLLIYKGYNIYPREIEELLMADPTVLEAAVVGRNIIDLGEVPIAFVVPRPGNQIDVDALTSSVNEQLIPVKRIREMRVIEELPVSAAGKVLKRELSARVNGVSV